MEFIVQLFRAAANYRRLGILRLLAVLNEMTVSELARATRIDITLVSAHLKVLAASGLVWRRRSAARVSYRLAESPGSPVTAAVLRALTSVFASVTEKEPSRVATADQADSAVASDAALFSFFTAFTHPRRLQIIRHLTRRQMASLAELTATLSMSVRACLRHLDKLERRGLVRRDAPRSRAGYALKNVAGPMQRAMMRAVLDYLALPPRR